MAQRDVIKLFLKLRKPMSTKEIAERLNIPMGTAAKNCKSLFRGKELIRTPVHEFQKEYPNLHQFCFIYELNEVMFS
jgi:predicted transcriptional regulator